jgi:hypothetical protein
MLAPMNPYKKIAYAIIFGKMEIENEPFPHALVHEYIDQMNERSKDKGRVFYTILMRNMIAPDAIRNASHWEQTKKTIDEVIVYCNSKVNENRTIKPKVNVRKSETSGHPDKKHYTINDICKTEKAEKIIKLLLKEMELTEADGTCLVKKRKGTTLFATIDAVKDNYNLLLERKYEDSELLNAFNNSLKLPFTQLKRNGKSFEKDKKNAIAQINKLQSLIKK